MENMINIWKTQFKKQIYGFLHVSGATGGYLIQLYHILFITFVFDAECLPGVPGGSGEGPSLLSPKGVYEIKI